MNYVLSVISGVLLMLAFPEYNLSWLAWIALVPLLIALLHTRAPRQAAVLGFITGVIYFGGVFNWIKIVGIWVGPVLGILAWVTLTTFQAFFCALFAWGFHWLNSYLSNEREQKSSFALEIVIPSLLWAVCEWARAQGPFAVPGGSLAASQYTILPILQIVAVVGSFGLSCIMISVNYAIARGIDLFIDRELIDDRQKKITGGVWIVAISCVAVMVAYGMFTLNVTSERPSSIKQLSIGMLQPNVPQEQKLDPENYDENKNALIAETKRFSAIQKVDLIIWPETVIPQLLLRDRAFIFRIKEAARTYVLFGTPTFIDQHIYNSMVLINAQGREIAFYHKHHLAPFGEYLPFRPLLYPLLARTHFYDSDYSFGKRDQEFFTPWGRFAGGVCFESLLPFSIREQVRKGAQAIVIITNDAWFKRTAALEQHLALSVLRAVENRRWLLQSANTGYSAIVDTRGRIIARSSIEHQEWITGTISLETGQSLYTRFGDWIVYVSLFFVLMIGFRCAQQQYGAARTARRQRLLQEMS